MGGLVGVVRSRCRGLSVLAVSGVVALAAAGCGPTWGSFTELTPPGSDGQVVGVRIARGFYDDVSCRSAGGGSTWCLAVGKYADDVTGYIMAASWDGARWAQLPDVPLPPGLAIYPVRVACAQKDSCVVIAAEGTNYYGSVGALASWDGTAWAVSTVGRRPGATGSASIEDVACGGPDSCLAVGVIQEPVGTSTPFAERWDGHSWSPVEAPAPDLFPQPAPSGASRLTCATPTFCLRLGSALTNSGARNTLQRWNGSSWTTVAAPFLGNGQGDSALGNDIECPTVNACVVVGQGNLRPPTQPGGLTDPQSIVAQWNGIAWARRVLPAPVDSPEASGPPVVSCAAPNRCVVVAWNGPTGLRTWVGPPFVSKASSPPSSGWLTIGHAVSCSGAGGTCLAVGERASASGGERLPIAYSIPAPSATTG